MKLGGLAILVLILFLGFLLRFYWLASVPPSIDWDEQSLGWNAYSLLKTGSDEYGVPFPVSIRSFNDYKPPLYAYISAIPIAAFGLNEWSVRVLSAVVGILTVLALYLLVFRLTSRPVAQLAALLFAANPWHLQFSRVAFETNLALSFFIFGLLFLLNFLRSGGIFPLFLAAFNLIAALYSYHSARLVVPVFIVFFAFFHRRKLADNWKKVLAVCLIGFVLLFPLLRSTMRVGSLQARFSVVSIFNAETNLTSLHGQGFAADGTKVFSNLSGLVFHSPAFVLGWTFLSNYFSHFNFDFLFLNGDYNPRHHAPGVGLFLLIEFPLILSGIYFAIARKQRWATIPFLWLLSAPVASALTNDTPHAVRAFMMLPPLQIFAAYAAVEIFGEVNMLIRKAKLIKYFAALAFSLILSGNLIYFTHQYFIHLNLEYAPGWQYGYKQMVNKVQQLKNSYDLIYVTTDYDQPYIAFLFFGQVPPEIKNNTYFYSGFDKYIFADYCSLDESRRPDRTLKILTVHSTLKPVCPQIEVLDEVNYPDGSPAFLIGRTHI